MESARDDVYCLEIARRTVARAALRLGIKAMTEECLNVLGDILLTYLQRIGQKLSHLVESSGRTSAHVNVLDTLQAIELCTSPAVQRMHIMNQNESDVSMMGELFSSASAAATTDTQQQQQQKYQSSSSANTQQPLTWQGLAEFCFGPDWYKEISREEQQQHERNRLVSFRGVGGKEGPDSTADNADQNKDNPLDDSHATTTSGWVAPYPDEIPHFPQSSWEGSSSSANIRSSSNNYAATLTANPHNLPPSVAQSLHSVAAASSEEEQKQQQHVEEVMDGQDGSNQFDLQIREKQLKNIPDEAFTTWGSIGTTSNKTTEERTESNKRKHYQLMDEERQKRLEGDAGGGGGSGTDADGGTTTPSGGASVTSDSPAKKKAKLDETTTTAAGTTANAATAADASAKDGNSSATSKKPADKDEKNKDATGAKNDNDPTSTSNKTISHKRYVNNNNPSYIPPFYPKLPRARTSLSGRTVLDFHYQDDGAATTSDNNEVTTESLSVEQEEEQQRRKWLLQQQVLQQQLDDKKHQQSHALASNSADATTGAATTTGGTTDNDAAFGLRSALVQFGQSYWGSGWDTAPVAAGEQEANTSKRQQQQQQVRVPLGRNDMETQQDGASGAGQSSSAQKSNEPTIVPLGRASGSRVSRILEGSMDAATML